MTKPIIEIENLGKRYLIGAHKEPYLSLRHEIAKVFSLSAHRNRAAEREFWALRKMSFNIHEGEVIGIIGRNGAGKSTLLKVVSQITPPTEGAITMRGRVASLLEVGTGFHPELTGRENIFLNGAILGMTRREIRSKFDAIVEFAEIGKFLDTPVKRYSSGMYVRLAFAVAAHLEPEILLVDEVLAVGDAQFQKKCLGKMSEVSRQGHTVLFVSHNMTAVRHLCSSCLWLERGLVHEIGSCTEVVEHYLAASLSMGNLITSEQRGIVKDEALVLSAFRTTDETGREKVKFSTTDEIWVDIAYEIPDAVQRLRVGFDLLALQGGDVVFMTFDDDIKPQTRMAGRYLTRARIPPNLLKPGHYEVRLQIAIHLIRWIINGTVSRTIAITHDAGVNLLYDDQRPGLIRPAIEWTITQRDGLRHGQCTEHSPSAS
jgi:lipopolysaccharide transport system ATP-binding protein